MPLNCDEEQKIATESEVPTVNIAGLLKTDDTWRGHHELPEDGNDVRIIPVDDGETVEEVQLQVK